MLACAALLALPAMASAASQTLCVGMNIAGCDFGDLDLETALDIANNAPAEKDTIKIAPGTFTASSNQFVADSLVDIVGSGVNQTTLQAGASPTYTIYLVIAGSTIKDLTILQANSAPYGLVLLGSTGENLSIVARDDRPVNNGKGVYMNSGNSGLKNSTVTMPLGGTHNDWAVWINTGGTNLLDNVTLTGDNAVVANSGNVTVNKSSLTGHRVYVVNGAGSATINNSVVKSTPGSTGTPMGLQNVSNGANVTTLTTNHVTVIGPGAGQGLVTTQTSACANGSATTTLNSSTVSGFPQDSIQDAPSCANVGGSGATTCPAAVANSANVQLNYSHAENGNFSISDGCRGLDNFASGTPGFVSATDLRPRQPSPLIDKGTTTADSGGETDFRGAPRVVDGDGTGGARRDMGAYEYQRSAPTVSVGATPASGPVSTAFAFNANAADADGESLTYIWTFDDGSFSTASSLSKTFGSLGTHSAEVQVIDPSSLSAKATTTVNVTNPQPTATPTPTVVPTPKDTTAPKVTVKGGTLTVDKKGNVALTIGCPATETAPCQIGLAASSKKKIAFKKGKPKKIQKLGTGKGSVPNGKSAVVNLKLSKAAFAYLKKKKKLPARFSVTAKDAAGNTNSVTVNITLKAPKK
jgi:cytochrome c5